MDLRFYHFICTQCKEPPDAGKIFPLLAHSGTVNEDGEEPDDLLTFQQVTASLTQYQQ